ncbi:MAG: GNAT family N-acetyltransferase [Deltaproteobacteria bacterium]|nr:GNAT family N-acetyltransferase [Deltaproteobacteria bacterium]
MSGESPFNKDRRVCPFLVRDGGRILARVLAVMDARYNRHWNEHLGHLCWFEALRDTRAAVQLLIDEACAWLQNQGATAARVGSGMLEQPFVIDVYDALPSPALRHNPAYYHALLKNAGCELEKSYVDYKVAVDSELVARLESLRETALQENFEILPLRAIPKDRRVREFTAMFNDTFKAHWGWSPYTEAEIAALLQAAEEVGVLDASMLAYRENEAIGMLLLIPERSNDVVVKFPYQLHDSERLNVLAIGVRETVRGHGVNTAMFSHGLLELVRRGAKYLSCSSVLEDNWPSRRAAEKLGAFACANSVVYRRNFS